MSRGPIFIVGCPRSGTGMLRDLLRSHPSISIPSESHFVPHLYRAAGDPRDPAEARKLGARILSMRTVARWELPLQPRDFAACRSYREAVELAYGRFAERDGKPRWGDKTPQYVAQLPLLGELFPDARFLHIYRDGRDVALSWLKRPHGPHNLFGAARAWRRLLERGRRDGPALGDRYLEVRYERLLRSPEEVMREVCEHLEEPFVPEVLRLAERPLAEASKRPVGIGPRRRPEILSSNGEKWRTEMSLNDRSVFESVAGEMLEELGYETQGVARPLSALRRASLSGQNLYWMALSKRRFRQYSLGNAALLLGARARRGLTQRRST